MKTVTYTLSLTIVRPLPTEAPPADRSDWARGRDARRELEQSVLAALREIDGDCHVEVLNAEVTP